jgi:hypothetical protein
VPFSEVGGGGQRRKSSREPVEGRDLNSGNRSLTVVPPRDIRCEHSVKRSRMQFIKSFVENISKLWQNTLFASVSSCVQ